MEESASGLTASWLLGSAYDACAVLLRLPLLLPLRDGRARSRRGGRCQWQKNRRWGPRSCTSGRWPARSGRWPPRALIWFGRFVKLRCCLRNIGRRAMGKALLRWRLSGLRGLRTGILLVRLCSRLLLLRGRTWKVELLSRFLPLGWLLPSWDVLQAARPIHKLATLWRPEPALRPLLLPGADFSAQRIWHGVRPGSLVAHPRSSSRRTRRPVVGPPSACDCRHVVSKAEAGKHDLHLLVMDKSYHSDSINISSFHSR